MKQFVSILMMLLMHQLAKGCFAAQLGRNAPRFELGARASNTRFVTGEKYGYVPIQTSICLETGKVGNSCLDQRYDNIRPLMSRNIFDLRGGDNCRELNKQQNRENADTKDVIIDSELIGIADLRQNPEADCIILAQVGDPNPSTTAGDERDDICAPFLQTVLFSSDTIDSTPHGDIDQQAAAASLTIGSSCSTIYLVISYDFKHGKTVLHRTLGGTKLMSLIDGVRKRWHDSLSSKPASTKLVLLLVPYVAANNGEMEESIIEPNTPEEELYDLSQHSEWKNDGATFLVERLKTYFELGGEEYQGTNPFSDLDVIQVRDKRMQPPQSGQNEDNEYDPKIRFNIVLRHIQRCSKHRTYSEAVHSFSSPNFRSVIERKFELFGGLGGLAFS